MTDSPGITEEEASFILAALPSGAGDELAFLVDRRANLYFAHRTPPAPGEPESAITRLIAGIYERWPSMAREIVRARIYATAEPTPMCRGMVKVAAKRISAPIPPSHASGARLERFRIEEVSPLPASTFAEASGNDPRIEIGGSPEEVMRAAFDLLARLPRPDGPLHARDRGVAALLVGADGQLLAWATNTNARNRTLHAEMNLAWRHWLRWRRPIPRGARIFTTLQPCKMCAGTIAHCAEDMRTLEVWFGQEDPGPNARATALSAIERHLPVDHR